uniref:Ribosomal protein S1 n=1 Tax=Dictyomenia sonderi TaxID=2007178 RepID=A0A1Z1MTD3_9FLOR|nr:ribosomal protein S1 [Dictyomenia sonderi]ARW69206.1 ribosomal protein S1 [Dictyomenia sonderi]
MINKKHKFAEILKKYNYRLHSGDIVAGTITHNEKIGFLVDIGTDKVGYLPKEELIINFNNIIQNNLMLINTTRDFFLITENINTKQYILSIKRLDYIRAWKRIKQMYIEDIIFKLPIYHINKGGIITYLEGIQGFIPKSHVCCKIKSNITSKILTINDNKNQLILSNKSAQLKISSHKFKIGELLYGKIIILKSYGLFIDIYGIKALLHISEIGNINHNTKAFIKGQLIKIKIIHLNIKHGQVSASIRQLKNGTTHHQQ